MPFDKRTQNAENSLHKTDTTIEWNYLIFFTSLVVRHMYMYPPTLPPLQRLSLSQQASKQCHLMEHQNNVIFCLTNYSFGKLATQSFSQNLRPLSSLKPNL